MSNLPGSLEATFPSLKKSIFNAWVFVSDFRMFKQKAYTNFTRGSLNRISPQIFLVWFLQSWQVVLRFWLSKRRACKFGEKQSAQVPRTITMGCGQWSSVFEPWNLLKMKWNRDRFAYIQLSFLCRWQAKRELQNERLLPGWLRLFRQEDVKSAELQSMFLLRDAPLVEGQCAPQSLRYH